MELIIAAAAIALIASVYVLTTYYQRREAERHKPNPALDTLNTTNYNMEALEEKQFRGLDPDEAERLVHNWKKSGYIPSHREFYIVQRSLRRDAKAKLRDMQENW